MNLRQPNRIENRLKTIEIFEELYDELEFLSGSYAELDDAAMSIFELYDNGNYCELIVAPRWEELQHKVTEVEGRATAIAGLITRCRVRLATLYESSKAKQHYLRLVTHMTSNTAHEQIKGTKT